MAAAQFTAALTWLGFNQESIASLKANGLTRASDLLNLDEKDVAQILKIIRTGPPLIVVPYLEQKSLNTFCFRATRISRLGNRLMHGNSHKRP
jgi:hypothetical protein